MEKNLSHCCCTPHRSDNSFFKVIMALCFFIGFCLYIFSFFTSSFVVVLSSYLLLGYSVIYNTFKLFLQKDFFNENALMTIASLGALYIGHYEEAIAVMLFYIVGEFLQDKAVSKSNQSIENILNIMPSFAYKKTSQGIVSLKPEEIQIGDTIVIKNGERIPLDGVIIKGETTVDTSSITGESLPRFLKEGEVALSGFINLGAVIEVKVTEMYENSHISRILDLIKNAGNKKTKTENYMRRVSRFYTPLIFFLALMVWILPPLISAQYDFNDWFYNALVLLVIACPCALTLSIPLSFFSAIGKYSQSGILVKGSQYIELIAKTKHMIFDKTGNLTHGKFEIQDILTFNNYPKDQLLSLLYHIENLSNHPLALAIVEYTQKHFNNQVPSLDLLKDLHIEEIQGHGMKATLKNDTYYVGNAHLLKRFNLNASSFEGSDNLTSIFIFHNQNHIGYITFQDALKSDVVELMEYLKKHKITTHILSGDQESTVKNVASLLKVDSFFGSLLPHQKQEKLEQIMANGITGFMGDGINDAPSLKRADIGISMGNFGSPIAIESSDMVIMDDKPSKLITCIKISKKTLRVLKQNITFVLTVKSTFIILGILGMMNMWGTIFADVGVSLMTIFNSIRIFR